MKHEAPQKNLRSFNSSIFITPKPNTELFKVSISYPGTVVETVFQITYEIALH